MNEYEEKASQFLKETGTKMTIRRVGIMNGFPFDNRDARPHYRYKVSLRKDNSYYTFSFYDSFYNFQKNIFPTEYDILASLTSYPVNEDVLCFASEFGYDMDTEESLRQVSRIHKACLKQYKRLCELFNEEEMQKLAEIQ